MALTPIQHRAIQLLAADLDYKEVAPLVGVSARTVAQWMQGRVFQKAMVVAVVTHWSLVASTTHTSQRTLGTVPRAIHEDDDEHPDA